MNIYLQLGASYKYDLADWLVNKDGVEKVYIDYYETAFQDCAEKIKNEKIVFLPTESYRENDAVDTYDVTECPMPDKRLMTDALMYESMAIRLAMRETNYPVNTYDEGRRRYLFYLRLWNNELQEKKINFIFFEETPHDMCLYVLYALAKIKGIKTLLINPTGIRLSNDSKGVYVYGNSIENLGKDIKEEYDKMQYAPGQIIQLKGMAEKYFEKSINRKSEASISKDKKKQWADYVYETEFARYDSEYPLIKYYLANLRIFIVSVLKHHNIKVYQKCRPAKKKRELWERVSIFKKYQSMELKEYDAMAKEPDYGQKYVYFPLQLNPEMTLFPLSGCYADQYNSIQMLSRITREYGIKVYVKEYFIQPYRERSFWDDLKKLDNVVLIKSSIPSDRLIASAFAVANQTGTILLEGVFYGKPALAFGGGHNWKGMPGIHEVISEESGKEIIKQLMKDSKIDMGDLKKYFYAIQNNSIEYYIETKTYQADRGEPRYWKTLEQLKRIIGRELGMS